MSQSQLPPVENGSEEEREEDADAAEELDEAAEETLERGNLLMNKGKMKEDPPPVAKKLKKADLLQLIPMRQDCLCF